MPETFADTLRSWNNFYFMAGGAAATLIGLLFVAVSLGATLVSADREAAINIFVTPILFYFISVMGIASLMLVPTDSYTVVAGLLLCVGVYGLGRMAVIIHGMMQLSRGQALDHGHWKWHATIPGLSYVVIAGTAVWLWVMPTAPLSGLAFATVFLLLSGIWRSWDLVLWIAYQRGSAGSS
jgi:hypothetical protein